MMSEELDLECEKLTAEWVHIEICRPMCNVLNAFEDKNFEIAKAFLNDKDLVKLKQEVTHNITNSLEALTELKRLIDEKHNMDFDDEGIIKEAAVLPIYESFLKMSIILMMAQDYISAHTEVADKGYGFLDNEKVVFHRDSLRERLESYKKFRKEKGYVVTPI